MIRGQKQIPKTNVGLSYPPPVDELLTFVYDKRDDFNFCIHPYMNSNISSKTAYAVFFIFQVVKFNSNINAKDEFKYNILIITSGL